MAVELLSVGDERVLHAERRSRSMHVRAVEEVDRVRNEGQLMIEPHELSLVTVAADAARQERRPDAGEGEALHELEIADDELARREEPRVAKRFAQVLTLLHATGVDDG